ncbi:MAG: leucine-rich repeat protein [Lachnospiraceae bacterium]|nr:leucine-rich repeat protein [Lachnospiraceae bacterium]
MKKKLSMLLALLLLTVEPMSIVQASESSDVILSETVSRTGSSSVIEQVSETLTVSEVEVQEMTAAEGSGSTQSSTSATDSSTQSKESAAAGSSAQSTESAAAGSSAQSTESATAAESSQSAASSSTGSTTQSDQTGVATESAQSTETEMTGSSTQDMGTADSSTAGTDAVGETDTDSGTAGESSTASDADVVIETEAGGTEGETDLTAGANTEEEADIEQETENAPVTGDSFLLDITETDTPALITADASWQVGGITATLEDGVLTLTGSGAMTDYTYDTYKEVPWYGYSIGQIIISEGITHVGDYAFAACSATGVALPYGLLSIGDFSFNGCAVQTVTIPSTVTSIGEAAFAYCTSLTSLSIPDSVQTLGDGLASGCTALRTASIGNSVSTVPYCAFYGCVSLTKATLGSAVTTIDGAAFFGCTSLNDITLPDGLKTIAAYAFYGCTALTALTIPSSVTAIEGGAFDGCTSLTLQLPSTLTQMDDGSYSASETVSLTGTFRYDDAYAVLELVNQERAAEGLSALTMDAELLEAAMLRAAEININFSHTRPSGLSCVTVSSKALGENIAVGYASASSVMNGWMNSEGHRANILTSDYQSIGIGCFTQGGTVYWVQLFGNEQAETASVPSNVEKSVTVALDAETYADYLYLYASGSTTLAVGESMTFEIRLKNKAATSNYAKLDAASFTWSGGSAASVSDSGTVTGQSVGNAVITATSVSGGLSASGAVTVSLGTCTITSLTNVSTGVKITWNAVSGAKGYRVYRITSAGTEKRIKTIKDGSTVTFTDKKIADKNGNTFTYKVVPYSGSSTGSFVEKSIVRLAGTTLTGAVNTAAGRAKITWTKSKKVTGYQLQYSTSQNFASGNKSKKIAGKSSVSKTLTGLTKGETYYVRIRTYKTVNGTTYYSAWSTLTAVTITK